MANLYEMNKTYRIENISKQSDALKIGSRTSYLWWGREEAPETATYVTCMAAAVQVSHR